MPTGSDPRDREIERLSESLQLCQQELAGVREEQERWAEQRGRLRRRKHVAEQRAVALSVALAERLRSEADRRRGDRLTGAVRRRIRPDRENMSEADQLEVIRSSPLFKPAWYLRNNLDVVEAGIDPAEHFLRVGAAQGRKPGPDFDTTAYLDAHPELREGGLNPLVHFVRTQPAASVTKPHQKP